MFKSLKTVRIFKNALLAIATSFLMIFISFMENREVYDYQSRTLITAEGLNPMIIVFLVFNLIAIPLYIFLMAREQKLLNKTNNSLNSFKEI